MLYESYIHPITIISSLPAASVGALLALFLTHTDLSIIATTSAGQRTSDKTIWSNRLNPGMGRILERYQPRRVHFGEPTGRSRNSCTAWNQSSSGDPSGQPLACHSV
jgi:hypothetical protein